MSYIRNLEQIFINHFLNHLKLFLMTQSNSRNMVIEETQIHWKTKMLSTIKHYILNFEDGKKKYRMALLDHDFE